jgi:hypothetical protein
MDAIAETPLVPAGDDAAAFLESRDPYRTDTTPLCAPD